MERSGCKGCESGRVEGTVGCMDGSGTQRPAEHRFNAEFIWHGWRLLLWEPSLAIPHCCAPNSSFRARSVNHIPPQCVVWWVSFSIKPVTSSIQSLLGTGSDGNEAGVASGQTWKPWQHSMVDSNYTSNEGNKFFPFFMLIYSYLLISLSVILHTGSTRPAEVFSTKKQRHFSSKTSRNMLCLC